MKNPYKKGSEGWHFWESCSRREIENNKNLVDIGKLISENITKITYNNERDYLEVEIVLRNTSKYTKEQKEHHIFIEDMIQTIYVDAEQFLEWRENNPK